MYFCRNLFGHATLPKSYTATLRQHEAKLQFRIHSFLFVNVLIIGGGLRCSPEAVHAAESYVRACDAVLNQQPNAGPAD